MPWFLKGNCVWSGTQEDPGEEVKCHESREAAAAHMKALYANVEDSASGDAGDKAVTVKVDGVVVEVVKGGAGATLKGGRGSGWHKPPEGTHTAENAPNFRGGPGADRTYGTERDEPPEGSKLCKCTECNSTFTLPKGKQCEDVKCPGCGGGATQSSPRKDPKAEGEAGRGGAGGGKKALSPSGTGNVHGEGSMLGQANVALGDGDSDCKCPKCGKGLPCTAKACPNCKESLDRVERREDEKRVTKKEGDGEHPAGHYLVAEDPEKPTTWHLRVRGADGELDHGLMGGAWAALHGGYRGNKYEGPNKELALAKLKRLYKQEGMDTPGEKSFTSYKSADGTWRWLAISNWAVVDKEREVVSEQAYRDAISHAQKAQDWGQLDLVHVNGTDVGDADMLFVLKGGHEPAKFGAGGTWHDTAKATRAREVIQAEPDAWGMSLKFRFNPDRLVRGVYTGDIQVLKHSILPQEMAASYGTAIAVQGGNMDKQLDAKAAEALEKLGHTPEEIAELAEKNKALPAEENVAEKEEAASVERDTIWKKLGEMLSIQGNVAASTPEEARKAEEVADPVQAVEEPVEKAQDETPSEDTSEVMKALVASIVTPLTEAMKAELDKRDERITELEKQIKGLNVDVEEKVAARLADVPPGALIAPTMVGATAAPEAPDGFTYGRQTPTAQKNFLPDLMKSISEAVEDTMGNAKYQA